jgi:hypothetical protein
MTNDELNIEMAKLCGAQLQVVGARGTPGYVFPDGSAVFPASTGWRPATDLKQCFEHVVPKMRELGCFLFLYSRGGKKLTIGFDSGGRMNDCYPASRIVGDFDAEARLICAAALKASEAINEKGDD